MPLLRRSGRHRQNGGRLQIGMVGAIRSERWAASDRNRWAAYVRIRSSRRHVTLLIRWEIPRLCRGDSRSLTFPGVSPGYPSMKLRVVSRQSTRKWSSTTTAENVPSGNRALHLVRIYGNNWGSVGRWYIVLIDERDEQAFRNCVGCQEQGGSPPRADKSPALTGHFSGLQFRGRVSDPDRRFERRQP
jgi:hypothetical protein